MPALVEKKKLNWQHPYLGYEIKNDINPKDVVAHLLKFSYCGVANGRASLGSKSIRKQDRY